MERTKDEYTANAALVTNGHDYGNASRTPLGHAHNVPQHPTVDPALIAYQPLDNNQAPAQLKDGGLQDTFSGQPQASTGAGLPLPYEPNEDKIQVFNPGTVHPDDDKALMPPPTAPASMLYYLRPTDSAPPSTHRINDPFIASRLVAVTVTLFRQGKGKEAKALAQFTVDSIADDLWHKFLQIYMTSRMGEVDTAFASEMLDEAAEELRKVDVVRGGFLGVLKGLIN